MTIPTAGNKPVPECLYQNDPLVMGSWMLQETSIQNGNQRDFYERGGSGNTINFDDDLLIFHCDQTGSFYDIYGKIIPFDWRYQDENKTRIHLELKYPEGEAHLYYSMIRFENDIFSGILQYTAPDGMKVMAGFKRLLKKPSEVNPDTL